MFRNIAIGAAEAQGANRTAPHDEPIRLRQSLPKANLPPVPEQPPSIFDAILRHEKEQLTAVAQPAQGGVSGDCADRFTDHSSSSSSDYEPLVRLRKRKAERHSFFDAAFAQMSILGANLGCDLKPLVARHTGASGDIR